MTRHAQHLADQRAKMQARIDQLRQDQRRVEAAQRSLERQHLQTRYLQVGKLVEAAGLLPQDDATLSQGFTLLASLIHRGHLEWAVQHQEPDAAVDSEGATLIASGTTLTAEHDTPLQAVDDEESLSEREETNSVQTKSTFLSRFGEATKDKWR